MPEQFKELTLREYQAVIKGWQMRHRWFWEPFALLAAFLSAHFKKKYTQKDILVSTGYAHLAPPTKRYEDVQSEKKRLKEIAKLYGG
jgi:hypothetical protein